MKKGNNCAWFSRIAVGLSLVFGSVVSPVKAQLSGTVTVPGTYSSIAAFVTAVNTNGVGSGGVTCNVAGGHTETLSSPIILTATGTALNPIIIQKSGTGSNPLITAYTGGISTPSSAAPDGIFVLSGSDYVTITQIDLTENSSNSTNPSTMEFGYGLFKASAANGCQHVTIDQCTITLSNINNAGFTAPMQSGSVGIVQMNSTITAATTALTPSSTAGTNRNNTYSRNYIQNCNNGMALIGYAPTAFTNHQLLDSNNVVGGSSSALGNTIVNFGGVSGSTLAVSGIILGGQYGFKVLHNTINNNNGSGSDHPTTVYGIQSGAAIGSSGQINNNAVTTKFAGVSASVYGIYNIAGASGTANSIQMNANTLTNCTQGTTATGAFYGIWNAASVATLSMTGNTFTGNTSAGPSGLMYLLYNNGAVSVSNTMTGNTIGHTFIGTSGYTSSIYGLYNASGSTGSTVNISSNTFTGFPMNATGTGAIYFLYHSPSVSSLTINSNSWSGLTLNHSGSEYFIYNTSSTQSALTVNNNTINNVTRTGASGLCYLYYAGGSALGSSTQVMTGNSFTNITSTTTGSGTFYGIGNLDGSSSPYPSKTITNNTLANITYNTTGTAYGIYINYLGDGGGTTGSVISGNSISGFSTSGTQYVLYSGSTATTNYATNLFNNTVSGVTNNSSSSTLFAMYVGANSSGGINVYNNKVYDCQSNTTSGIVHGLYTLSSSPYNIYNNIIGNLTAPASSNALAVNGMYFNTGSTINAHYNSIYLNASSTGAVFGANGIYSSTTPTLVLRNNIVVNTSTPNSTGYSTAYRRSSSTFGTYSTSSNGNLFYVGTPSTTQVIFFDGTTARQTMSDYKVHASPADGTSVTENPPFISTTGSNANFLHISTATPTQVESGGVSVSGVSTDFDGNIRFGETGYSGTGSAPDIGADEGNFLPADFTAPTILHDALSFTCNTGNRIISSVNISDGSGIALSGSLVPRVYHKKGINGTWTSAAGTYLSGNSTSSDWTFTINSSTLGGLTTGDTVYYYLVSQDVNGTPNVGSVPATGFSASSVNTITTHPTTPFSYTISPNLSGTYYVGSGGDFSTLTASAAAYNNSCIINDVTFALTDTLYSTSEVFPVVFASNGYAGSDTRLTIKPDTGVSVVVTGASTAALIKLNGADYITIDGSDDGSNGRDLTFHNTNTTSSTVLWNASLGGVGNGATHNTFKNLVIKGGSGTVSTLYGIGSGNTNSVTAAGEGNDNLTIENCKFSKVGVGISALNSTNTLLSMDSLVIVGNEIGDANSADFITIKGMQVSYANAPIIEHNNIMNIKTITSVNCSGIEIQAGVINPYINANRISGIWSTSSGGWGAYGINFSSATLTTGAMVTNNMISDVLTANYSTSSTTYNAFGIRLAGGTNPTIIHNTINMYDTATSGTSAGMSANIVITTASVTGLVAKNNILVNKQSFTAANSFNYNIYVSSTSTTVSSVDYNDYVGASSSTSTYRVGYFGSALTTLSDWQTATSLDANTESIDPNFLADNDLHLDPTNNFLLSDLGVSATGVTTDFDEQFRSASAPDMGADEYDDDCSTYFSIALSDSVIGLCPNTTDMITSTVDPTTAIVYQWMLNGSAISGANASSLTVSAVGIYTLQVTDTITGCMDTSASVEVYQHLATAFDQEPIGIVACAGSIDTLWSSATGTGPFNYQWYKNGQAISQATDSVLAFTGLQSNEAGTYYVEVTGFCNSATSTTVSVAVSDVQAQASAAPIVCNGGQTEVIVTASSGFSPYVGTGTFTQVAGTYSYIVGDSIGCADTVTITLTEPNVLISSQSFDLCFGESVTVGSNTYSQSGTYVDVLTSVDGCDSTVTTTLVVEDQITTSVTLSGATATADQSAAQYQWINCSTNTPIANEIGQSFTATTSGQYAVEITVNNCSDTSNCVNIVVIGIDERAQGQTVKAFPNPSDGELQVISEFSGMFEIRNALGQLIDMIQLTAGRSEQVSLRHHGPGMYFIVSPVGTVTPLIVK